MDGGNRKSSGGSSGHITNFFKFIVASASTSGNGRKAAAARLMCKKKMAVQYVVSSEKRFLRFERKPVGFPAMGAKFFWRPPWDGAPCPAPPGPGQRVARPRRHFFEFERKFRPSLSIRGRWVFWMPYSGTKPAWGQNPSEAHSVKTIAGERVSQWGGTAIPWGDRRSIRMTQPENEG